MATTLLRTTRPTTSYLLSTVSIPRLVILLPWTTTSPSSFRTSTTPHSDGRIRIGGLLQSLQDLLPPILWAVPKSKTTHSKKSMRSSGKGLKQRTNLVGCASCGLPKVSHTICHECHVAFRKEIHAEAKMMRKG
ncbi:BQ2448_1000 [Microbotryum intermedium]|uniref:Large ribosomal subunit protein bL32m n=1 Tax=Microbotryum intermedium TaxID=269621 RepID=A0A238F7Z4_9BASI|nr:BQ2448_1000 [Microbotryum intermedium]